MIPIKFRSGTSVDILYEELFDGFASEKKNGEITEKGKERMQMFQKIEDWCFDKLGLPFEVIIKADYETINWIRREYEVVCQQSGQLPEEYKNFIIEILYKQRFPRKRFVEELQVTVCPYCNRNFVNSTYKRTMCELDHFFDKAQYPILAVSFYNLIPVCHPCNHVKANRQIRYSPHDTKYHTDELLTFDFFIKGLNFLYDKEQIGIDMDCNKVFEENARILKLNDVYQIHSDLVQEHIKKSIIFNKDYMKNLYQMYEGLFESEEELYRVVFGNYTEEADYGKRPLAKLAKDISDILSTYN